MKSAEMRSLLALASRDCPQEQGLNRESEAKNFMASFAEDLTSIGFGSAARQQRQQLLFILAENQHILQTIASRFSQKIGSLTQLRHHLGLIHTQFEQRKDQVQPADDRVPEFKYALELDEALPAYFVKGRKFQLAFRLIDKAGLFVDNHNKLLLECRLFRGLREVIWREEERPFLRYSPESAVSRGRGRLVRAEINLVSSKMRTKALSIEVRAEEQQMLGEEERRVRAADVRPLLLTNICVKSKNYKLPRTG